MIGIFHESIPRADLLQRLAGSLLHFIWQGTIIAMVAAVVLKLLANRSAQWRYTVSVASLLLMMAAPIVSFVFYVQTGRVTLEVLEFIRNMMEGAVQSAAQTEVTASWTQWIVLTWFTGVLVCSLRLIAGWRMSAGLSRIGTSSVPAGIQRIFDEIQVRLVAAKTVRLFVSQRVDTPVAVGWLHPVVLLPAATLIGLTELQLRAVLAHELAHIRRHDFLVNLVQRVVESILFYHPAVWYFQADSHRTRALLRRSRRTNRR